MQRAGFPLNLMEQSIICGADSVDGRIFLAMTKTGRAFWNCAAVRARLGKCNVPDTLRQIVKSEN